jgi:hypothetical protein
VVGIRVIAQALHHAIVISLVMEAMGLEQIDELIN